MISFGYTPEEYWSLTPRDTIQVARGFFIKYEREKQNLKLISELIRWVGSMIYNVNAKRGKNPDKLITLPFDQEKTPQKKLSDEQIKELERKFKKGEKKAKRI